MKEPAHPYAGGKLMERVQDQQEGPGPEAAGRVTRPRAGCSEKDREPAERDPPPGPIRSPGERRAPGDDSGARDDSREARAKVARGRDLDEWPPRARVTEDRELDGLGQGLGTRDDDGAGRRQHEASHQTPARPRIPPPPRPHPHPPEP